MIDNRVYMEGIYTNDYGMSGVRRPPRRRPRQHLSYYADDETGSIKRRRYWQGHGRFAPGKGGGRLAWRMIRLVGPAVAGASAFMLVLAGT